MAGWVKLIVGQREFAKKQKRALESRLDFIPKVSPVCRLPAGDAIMVAGPAADDGFTADPSHLQCKLHPFIGDCMQLP